MKKPRILLAEDHPTMVIALWGLIEDELGEVVGTVADGETLLEEAQRLKPDIIITDISMPKLNGLEATRALQHTVPQCKVIMLTSHCEPVYKTLAFEVGARGYLLKRTSLHTELAQAVLHVLAGDCYIGHGREWEKSGRSPVRASPWFAIACEGLSGEEAGEAGDCDGRPRWPTG